jgi:hypothetical protein
MIMKKIATGVALLLVVALSVPLEVLAQQQSGAGGTGQLQVGAYLGLQEGTFDNNTAFALVFNADYFLDNHFSVGPLFQLGFTGDLTQVGISMQSKYTFDLSKAPKVKPHLQGGLGFIHVDMDQPPVIPGGQESDLAFLIPFGGGFDLELSKNLSVGSTLLLNFTDADIDSIDRVGNIFMTWIFGVTLKL